MPAAKPAAARAISKIVFWERFGEMKTTAKRKERRHCSDFMSLFIIKGVLLLLFFSVCGKHNRAIEMSKRCEKIIHRWIGYEIDVKILQLVILC